MGAGFGNSKPTGGCREKKRQDKTRKENQGKERKGKERKGKEGKRREQKRLCLLACQFNEKPRIILGCPVGVGRLSP